ncbi:permease [Streptococcus caviae]|uniref:permease n=1 Tax=Streptococcus sp. 'caviae' TaxID=1915004 RepID=UPI00094B8676|nr:permease [Streptococcus sp. 'caviae']OLN83053.1 permease [Streptococcus sp. 'caviae']
MFGKLLKYEFKSVGAWFFGLYGLAIFISLGLGLWFHHNIGLNKETVVNSNTQDILLFALSSALAAVFIAILIATLLIIIRCFYNNIFGREGYLTLTLPVSTHKTILAKLLTAFIWNVCSAMVFIISVSLLVLPSLHRVRPSYLSDLMNSIKDGFFSLKIILVALLLIVVIFTSILEIYFSISLGQLFQDYRGLLAFTFYFVINLTRSFLAYLAAGAGDGLEFLVLSNNYSDHYNLILNIIVTAIYGIIFYFGTHYIIKNKLNIQ